MVGPKPVSVSAAQNGEFVIGCGWQVIMVTRQTLKDIVEKGAKALQESEKQKEQEHDCAGAD